MSSRRQGQGRMDSGNEANEEVKMEANQTGAICTLKSPAAH